MQDIIVYVDGACSGNPGPGGWGVVVYKNGNIEEFCGGEDNTTNNQMELKAAINGLKIISTKSKIKIFTDSMYVKNGITLWIKKWQINNWRAANNRLVKNCNLWRELLKQTERHEVEWHWVRSHCDDDGNIKADLLARKGCKKILG